MKRLRTGLWLVGLVGLQLGCGGRVIDDSGSDAFTPSDFLPSGSAAGKGGSSGKPRPGSPSSSLPSKQLGECVPGFLRAEHPELPCRWLTEVGMCFEETDAACACICPTDKDSVCAHGFEGGPNDAKPIVCD